jgi:hypothetical protein
MRKDLIHQSRNFKLVKGYRKHKPDGKPVYRIVMDGWNMPVNSWDEVREFIDPNRNRGNYNSWTFKNREEAVQMFSLLVLKWP